ncbi:hypothetical protein E6C27_scaffold594G00030 [Cucumis melo var. makuwa]|uniref:Mucin-19-like n=1 Tax=Cucumis melo var. makuwa TaxID=1194695 RepID=A0A5A7UCH3_CUCMM|nr:hypothetical protein E6C27_scaffold594G00030 [Cucumis melo var. makuwa]
MKNVGANSDNDLVLFDEENRAVGFHSKSGGLRESDLYVFRPHYDKDDGSAGRALLHCSACKGDRGLTLKFTVPRQVHLGIAPFTRVDLLSVDSIEGHNQVSGKGFPTTGPRIEAGNVVIHRGLHVSNVTASCSLCAIGSKELVVEGRLIRASFGITRLIPASFGSTRLIRASFGSTRLICASLGITRLIGVSFGITRLIRASFGITRLMCAFYETTRLLCRVRVQRGADRRGARRMREGHMDASGFLYASADVFC